MASNKQKKPPEYPTDELNKNKCIYFYFLVEGRTKRSKCN